MDRQTFASLTREAIRDVAAAVVYREENLGFHFPNVTLKTIDGSWTIEGNIFIQLGDDHVPLVVDWAMTHTEGLMLEREEDYDHDLGHDIPEAQRAKAIVAEFRNEILDRTERVIADLLKQHRIFLV